MLQYDFKNKVTDNDMMWHVTLQGRAMGLRGAAIVRRWCDSRSGYEADRVW